MTSSSFRISERAAPNVLRLAMLHALADSSGLTRAEHLKAALGIWSYCRASAQLIFFKDRRRNRIRLGCGGSDNSAVLLVATPGCDVCLFKASCDGVYDTDHNRVALARRYESLTHDQACDLARAQKSAIRVRPAFAEGFGTVIKTC